MIYIVGHIFTFSPRNSSGATRSIQEQMALKRLNQPSTKVTSLFDPRFVVGNKYRLSKISKIKLENNVINVEYLFSDISNPNNPDINVVLSNTGKGDDYIAAMSGKTQELNQERQIIAASFENDSNL